MAQIIKIKRSVLTATPSTLQQGEMAYSEQSGNLFIGTSGDNIVVIGGFTLVDKVAGIETGAEVNAVTTVATRTGDIVLTKTDVGLNNVDNLQQIPMSYKGANSGVAELDSGGKVPSSQLPSYVDDVIEVADFASLPTTGSSGVLYITLDTNDLWRWGGSVYVLVSSGSGALVLGETNTTAYRGDRGKIAYDHSQLPSGNPHGVTKGDVALGNVDNTSDANKPISSATQTALDGKVDDSQVLTNVPVGAVFTDTTYSVGDNGLTEKNFTTTLLNKLNGISAGANNYTHPTNHSPSIITQDISNRFVTDAQIATWNAKLGPTSTIDGGTF